ncbi:aminopeptidase [Hymenopellis radicata]|nr:aminopeptidase [Hymenopellis radicata]
MLHAPMLAVFALLTTLVNAQSHLFLLQDIWPPGPGEALVPQEPPAELTGILNSISPARIESTIRTLVSFGTRHTLSNQTDPERGIGAARDWVASELRSYGGRLQVEVPSYIQPPASRIPTATNISDIIATLPGTTDPNRVYVVSGHYDSRVSDVMNFSDDAPGADDDGSGVAVSMELARVMATQELDATIIFAVVAGEEQGLYGSAFLADTLKNASVNVQGMLDNDIVGSSTADDGTTDPFNIRMFVRGIPPTDSARAIADRVDIGGENDAPARQLARFAVEVASNAVTNMSVQMIYRPDRYLRGGDQESFLNDGFPAVRFTEPHENFAHQHQDVRVVDGVQFGDLLEFCDFEFISRVAKVNGAILWSLASAPVTPQNVTLDSSTLTNNSTLRWSLDASVDAYEIVWRPTEVPFGHMLFLLVGLPRRRWNFRRIMCISG